MIPRSLSKTVLLCSVLLLSFGFAGAANAQGTTTVTGYGPLPGVTVDSSTSVQGGNITVRGQSCTPGSTVTVTFAGGQVGTAVVAANGTWVLTFAVPAGTVPGSYTVTESGCVAGGGSLSAGVVIVSGGGTTTGNLPYTGSSTDTPLRAGFVLLAVGSLLVFAASRRKAAATR